MSVLLNGAQLTDQPPSSEQREAVLAGLGNKARSLVQLTQAGFPVPAAAFIPAAVLRDCLRGTALQSLLAQLGTATDAEPRRLCEQLRESILQIDVPQALATEVAHFLQSFPDERFAVRSSGTLEDRADSSFAGLYTTVLDCDGHDAVIDGIRQCWASLFHERVVHYCQQRGLALEALGMGVVIQQMVPADISGVSFSVNPLTGADTQVVTEACRGLGEALVSGQVTPERYVVDWYHNCDIEAPQAAQPLLDKATRRRISRYCIDVQCLYGRPVDIEWAIAGERFFLLQARPITAVQHGGIDGEWSTADFKDGGVSATVCTPLMWSLYDFIWERSLPVYLKKTGLIADRTEQQWGKMFFGRPYWNLGAVKAGLRRLPGFRERDFDQSLGIEPTYEGPGYVTPTRLSTLGTGLLVLSRLRRSFKQQLAYCEQFLPAQRQRLAELDRENPADWSDAQLRDFFPRLIREDYWRSESSYFNLIFDNSNVSSLFNDFFAKLHRRHPELDYLSLLGGLTNLSHLQQMQSLWEVAHSLRDNREALSYWRDTPIETLVDDWRRQRACQGVGAGEIAAHLARFKHHAKRELEITAPRYGEDPSPVFVALQELLHNGGEAPMVRARQQQARYREARAQLLNAVPFWQRRRAGKRLDQLRAFLWWREELRDLSTHMYYHVRRFSLVLAQRLTDQRWLQDRDDLFYLPVDSLLAIVEGGAVREAIQSEIHNNRRYYQSFRHYQPPDEMGARYSQQPQSVAAGDNTLQGIPCSPGVIEGTARIVPDIDSADRLQPGDILITRCTDPGWTLKFAQLSAVVTETGGMLSHAAVVAREYGIPAVLAVQGATQRVVDGARVRVDGDTGVVELA